MNTVDIFSAIKDVILASAAVTTAYVAYTGLGKWQKELRGKANFEVARELIKSAYKLRDGLSNCRKPFRTMSELPEGYQLNKMSTREEEGQVWAHIYSKRWEPVSIAVQNFESAALEAEALWGISIREKANELRQYVHILRDNFDAYIQNEYSGGAILKDLELEVKVRKTIWDIKPEENELTLKINSVIEGLESEIRPHLSRS